MRTFLRAILFAALVVAVPAFAATYTVTGNSLVVHQGDPIPPLGWSLSTYSGAYSSLFTGEPTLTTTYTTSSGVGTYPITVAQGAMTVTSGNSLAFANGSIQVIPASLIGDQFKGYDAIYPSSLYSAPAYAVINVASNPVCNMVADNTSAVYGGTFNDSTATDNSLCQQNLLTFGRDYRSATVSVTGTAVTQTSGSMPLTGITGPVLIGGVICTVSSSTATTATLASACLGSGTTTGLTLRPNADVVTVTGGNTVTITSGAQYYSSLVGKSIFIGNVETTIATYVSATQVTTASTTLTNGTGFQSQVATNAGGYGRAPLQLYYPAPSTPGCYGMSQEMYVIGNYWTFFGDGPSSCVRLMASSPAFNAGSKVYWWNVASNSGNQNFREHIYNMRFNVGAGNPWVEALHWVGNNMASTRNVIVDNDDGAGLYGYGIEGAYDGPTFSRDTAIYGFQYGIYANGQVEYEHTFEGLTTEAQTVNPVVNGGFKLPIRHWLSASANTAYNNIGTKGTADILSSQIIYTGTGSATGLVNASGSQLHQLSSICTGYSPCEVDSGTGTAVTYTTLPAENITGTALSLFSTASAAASLPITVQEAGQPTDGAASGWTILSSDPTTWASAVSAASGTVYLPPGIYNAPSNVSLTIPSTVTHVNLNQFQFTSGTPTLTMTVADNSTTPLYIDTCAYGGSCYFVHSGSRPVIFRDALVGITNNTGAGNQVWDNGEFVSNLNATAGAAGPGPAWIAGQNITGWSIDIEVGSATDNVDYPKFTCAGCSMTFIGYKTEQDSSQINLSANASANIYGDFFYWLHACSSSTCPGTLFGGSTTAGSNVVTYTSGSVPSTCAAGQYISSSDGQFTYPATITACNTGTVTINQNATLTQTYTSTSTSTPPYIGQVVPVPPNASPINIADSSLFADPFVFVNTTGYGPINLANETQSGVARYSANPNTGLSQMYSYYSAGDGGTTPTAASITFSPAAETFTGTLAVTLACSTSSSTINYTLDGSTPTTGSAVYSAALSLSATTTVTAICSASGYTASSPTAATYTLGSTPPSSANGVSSSNTIFSNVVIP